MRTARVVLFVLILCASRLAMAEDESILKNGDFEKGKMGWKMEPGIRVVDEPGAAPGQPANQVLEAEAHKSRTRKMQAQLNVSTKAKALIFSMRVKASPSFRSATPSADQLTLRLERPDRSATFTSRRIATNDVWQTIDWNYTQLEGARRLDFSIEFHPGDGSVYVDDAVMKEE
ncbi:MAG: hypothetical protein V2A79_03135 [Planctomycetota bacterium]